MASFWLHDAVKSQIELMTNTGTVSKYCLAQSSLNAADASPSADCFFFHPRDLILLWIREVAPSKAPDVIVREILYSAILMQKTVQ